jgi:antitoxin component of MazEF toxin-antitoxin module
MQTQKIFQAGNSHAVVIPKAFADELGFRVGNNVVVEKSQDNTAIIIKQANIREKHISKKASDREFQKWLDVFMEEDGEILDELANR